MSRPIGIDLFAGVGGLSLGFEQAGFDVVAAVEIDPIHCAVHEFNFPNCKSICSSVADLSGDEIRELADINGKDVDIVFGGAPCQGFSLMGKRALDDPRNSLVRDFARLVCELDAKYFVFENVKGLTLGKHKDFLNELIKEFHANGYDVVMPYSVLNAAEYGVPQDRRRLFLLGAKKGLSLPTYPHAVSRSRKERTRSTFEQLPLCPSVWDAIGDLPEADSFPELQERDWVKSTFGEHSNYAKRMRGIIKTRGDYAYPRKWDNGLLTSSLRTEHTKKSKARFAKTAHGKTESVSRFFKLDPDGICNTLRAGTNSDKGAFTSPRPIHPYEPRCITVREAARLHSYPDWFRFHATKWHGFRQIGNSVPPMLAKAVATTIMDCLNVRVTKPKRVLSVQGTEHLLSINTTLAAARYEVDKNVTGTRLKGLYMATQNRYQALIVEIFKRHYIKGKNSFKFERGEIEDVAKDLNVKLPKNIGGLIYSFRYRAVLPVAITKTAPDGLEWRIEPAGRARYCFRLGRINRIVPREDLLAIKIPDATPEIIAANSLNDEQSLLAKVRYNRLIDIFLGITTYSMQNHLRTTVKGIGQIEIDELYVGVSKSGSQFIIPVQAKGGEDQLAVIQTQQDLACCAEKFPNLICRAISAQFMKENKIALFELIVDEAGDVLVVEERHYQLCLSSKITESDLKLYARKAE